MVNSAITRMEATVHHGKFGGGLQPRRVCLSWKNIRPIFGGMQQTDPNEQGNARHIGTRFGGSAQLANSGTDKRSSATGTFSRIDTAAGKHRGCSQRERRLQHQPNFSEPEQRGQRNRQRALRTGNVGSSEILAGRQI